MKRVQLIEMGILVVVLVLLHLFIVTFISFLVALFFMLSNNIPGQNVITPLILPLALYLAAIYILVTSRRSLARLLNGKNEEETVVQLSFSGRQLLHSAIIVICVTVFLNEIPQIVSLLTARGSRETYMSENGMEINKGLEYAQLYTSIFRVTLTILFAFLAKAISNLWSNNQENPSQ